MKLNVSSICCVAVYVCLGIFLIQFFKQPTIPLHVLNDYKDKEVNPPLYPDETIGALYQLMQGGILKGKQVAIWMPDSNAHNDAFSLKLAYTYFTPDSEKIVAINTPEDALRYDYVISPWEEYSLVSNGAKLIHDEHWLFVYQISKSPEK